MDNKHPFSQMVSERWYELHDLTGPDFLLLAFNSPSEWKDHFKAFWESKLGEKKFEPIWDAWKQGWGPAHSVNYGDLFNPPIKTSQLPCLVLFTEIDNLNEQQVVIRPLPTWNDTDALYYFFSGLVESIRECSKNPKEERLECLQSSLTERFPYSNYFEVIGYDVKDYLITHPADIVKTTTKFVAALASGGLLPLGANAKSILDAIAEVVG